VGELVLALEYLHSKRVVYRDLKLENIMLAEDRHIRIIDFGLSKMLTDSERTYTVLGSAEYMAPEILL
jgi:serine/threonine protein kinase